MTAREEVQPTSDPQSLIQTIVASGLISDGEIEKRLGEHAGGDGLQLLQRLMADGLLTKWQVAQLQAGKRRGFFLGHYKLLTPIGSGGMGQVFKAQDSRLQRLVAIKVLSRRTGIANAIERFRREAMAAFRLQHPNIVRTFELGQEGPMHFMVMEYVEGTNLRRYVDRHGRLSIELTARIGYEISLALEHARKVGVIHRDIKPSNIMLTRGGHAKLADMGLAKFFGNRVEDSQGITKTGYFMGSVDYCAPEQAEDARLAETASDIYSLGCTLYFCLTGGPPFIEGTEIQKIMAHRHEEPIRIEDLNPDVPGNFANLIHHDMLAKRPQDRFPSPSDAARAFQLWLPERAPRDPFALLEGIDPQGLMTVERLQPATSMFLTDSGSMRQRKSGLKRLLQIADADMVFPAWLFVGILIVTFLIGMIFSAILTSVAGY